MIHHEFGDFASEFARLGVDDLDCFAGGVGFGGGVLGWGEGLEEEVIASGEGFCFCF